MRLSGWAAVARLALFLVILGLPSAGQAQAVQGPYLAGGTGLALPSSLSAPHDAQEMTATPATAGSSPADQANAAINANAGATQSAAAGWGFGNGLRVEIQGLHSQQKMSGP